MPAPGRLSLTLPVQVKRSHSPTHQVPRGAASRPPGNSANLIREGINESKIVVTGNTVIDALRWAGGQAVGYGDPSLENLDEDPRRVVLASPHRRESWSMLHEIGAAIREIATTEAVRVVVPLHRNPVVRKAMLGEISFGFYICQGVVIFYGRTLFGPDPLSTPAAVLVTIALFIATLLAGWGLYSLVERPMMRRWARPRRTIHKASAQPAGS
jgi:hypothetical protein